MKRGQIGISLLELLAVMALIGVLAAIALPGLQDYRAHSLAAENMGLIVGKESALSQFYQTNNRWPSSLGSVYSTATEGGLTTLSGVAIGDNGYKITSKLKKVSYVGNSIDLPAVEFVTEDRGNTWHCSYPLGIDLRLLPVSCPEPDASNAPCFSAPSAAATAVMSGDYDPTQVDRIVAYLPCGHLAFNSPGSIQLGDSARIQLVLSEKSSQAELEKMVSAPGAKVSASIQMDERMKATLTSTGVVITPLSEAIQAVSSGTTTWEWEITATKLGHQFLHLDVCAIIVIKGDATPHCAKTYDKPIEVFVPPKPWWQVVLDFIERHWEWLAGAIVIPLIGYLWKFFKEKRAKRPPPPDLDDTDHDG